MAEEDDVVQRIVGLIDYAEGAVIQLNASLNKYLRERLVETREFLLTESVRESRQAIVEPLKALYRIVAEAKAIVQECCSLPWIPAAIRQAENKEAFFEVLKDLHWCTGVVKTATLKAFHGRGGSISGPEVPLFPEHNLTADAEESVIRKKVDAAAIRDKRALDSKLDEFIQNSDTDEADQSRAEHLAIARHLKLWFSPRRARDEAQEVPGNRTTLDGLTQGDFINKGAYGRVFKCTWHGLAFAEKDFFGEGGRKNLLEEAKVMRDMRHPNVVMAVAIAEDVAQGRLVLECMDGNLTNLITQEGPFRLADKVDILLQISKALLFLHEKRVAHCDIKSGNILYNISPEGYIHIKVADFGLSRVKLDSMMAMTINKGTREWTAPELIKMRTENFVQVDSDGVRVKEEVIVKHALRTADVYSFGITCFEVVTGQTHPYKAYCEGDLLRPPNFAHKVAVEGLRPRITDDIPKELAYLMQICWSRDPSRRPAFTYIYKFLRDFKASLLTDPDSPFSYEEWKGEVDSRWSMRWSSFLDTLAQAPGLVWRLLWVATVRAMRLVMLAFTKRFKSLEEITDRDMRSRQIPYETLESNRVGTGASENSRHVRLPEEVEATVTKTTALSEKVFLKGAFFLTQLKAHPNLPILPVLGYAVHDNNFYLVHKADSTNVLGSLYEVMDATGGGNWRARRKLTWAQRYNIALGVGQALTRLHQLSVPIIHGNLCSKNIMLEKDTFNPKLFNFYTSCMFPGSEINSNFLTNDTRGWDAPEKGACRGERATFAQDVYSFGVLLLVLVSDRNAYTTSDRRMLVHIVDEAWEHFHDGSIRGLEGPQVNGDPVVVLRVLKLALHCVQTEPHQRPTIVEAMNMLSGKTELKDNLLAMFRSSSLRVTNDHRAPSTSSSAAVPTRNASDVTGMLGRVLRNRHFST